MNPRGPLYLCLDQGGHSSRALVLDREGRVRASHRETVAIQRHGLGRVEQDPRELLQSLQRCLAEVAKQLGEGCRQVLAAGLCCQRSSVLCWRRDSGESLTAVLSWQDGRGQRAYSGAEQAWLQQHSGLPPTPYFGASKLQWCWQHEANVQSSHRNGQLVMGPLVSYLLRHLLTEANQPDYQDCCDKAVAARTQLLDGKTGRWSAALCDFFSLPLDCLPVLKNSDDHYGHIQMGGVSIPLGAVMADQGAAYLGINPREENCLSINLGSGAFLFYPCHPDQPNSRREKKLLKSLMAVSQGQNRYCWEGTVNGAANALSWFARQNQLHRQQLATLLKTLQGDKPCGIFINAVGGLGNPWWRSDIRSRYWPPACSEGNGSPEPNTGLERQVQALVESIAFMLQVNVQQLDLDSRGQNRPASIRLAGGLSQVDYLCQCLADLSGLVVQRLKQRECSSMGLLNVLTKTAPSFSENAIATQFLPRRAMALQQRYRRWLKAMAALGLP